MAKSGKGDDRSAYDLQAEKPSRVAAMLARAARDPAYLLRSLMLGEAVAERPHPVRPAPRSRHRK